MSASRTALVILGGTFDPIHHGHLRTAVEVAAALGSTEVRLIPAGAPLLRAPPVASAELRWQLLIAAVAGKSWLVPDNRELRRDGPSYTVTTLTELREEEGSRALCLVLGADAFAGIASWHRWPALLELAHLVVVHRPGYPLPAAGVPGELLARHGVATAAALLASPAGSVLPLPVTPLDISATALRALLASGGDPAFLVPDAVRELLLSSRCYLAPGVPGAVTPS